jgi:hypothetical protein
MAAETPSQRRLASALTSLKRLQDSGLTVLHTSDMSRDDREALVDAGLLKPVIKGWYMPSRPGESDGETTAWYASAAYFSPSWTAFQPDGGRDFRVIVDGVSV